MVRYEDLVENPMRQTKMMFEFVGLNVDKQTQNFLTDCHKKHHSNEYAVFKNKSVKDKWKTQLNSDIRKEIYRDIKNTDLEIYLNR